MEYKIEPKRKFTIGLGELWEYRELLYFFAWKDIKIKYKQTVLGILWVVLQPLIMMVIFTFFFGHTITNQVKLSMPYPVFALSGLLLWYVFSAGMITGSSSIVDNAHIIRKIYFPRLVIPISAIIVALFDFFISILLFIIVLIYYHTQVDMVRAIFSFFIGVVMSFFATIGPCCMIAALNIKYRDFKYVIPFMMQIMLFVTPIIYPSTITSKVWLQDIIALNPMVAPISVFRWGVIGSPLNPQELAISLCSALFFFITGIIVFRRIEYFFADIV